MTSVVPDGARPFLRETGYAAPPATAVTTPAATVTTPAATVTTPAATPAAPSATQLADELVNAVCQVVLGQPAAVQLAVAAVLAGEHVLIEDVPGVGKTLLAKSLARAMGGSFARIQGTADLLPADLTGVTVYDSRSGDWVFRPGPLFSSVVLFDEINRATPRAQSALLEAMAERHTTVEGEPRPLPDPFVVIATQNPYGDVGTFPLPHGQLDRFAVTLSLGLPDRATERALLLGAGGDHALATLTPLTTADNFARIRSELAGFHVAAPVAEYILDLVGATRTHPEIALGASPRGAQVLLSVSRGLAAANGRTFVTPDDVQIAAPAVLAHRLLLHRGARQPREVVGEVLTRVSAPVP